MVLLLNVHSVPSVSCGSVVAVVCLVHSWGVFIKWSVIVIIAVVVITFICCTRLDVSSRLLPHRLSSLITQRVFQFFKPPTFFSLIGSCCYCWKLWHYLLLLVIPVPVEFYTYIHMYIAAITYDRVCTFSFFCASWGCFTWFGLHLGIKCCTVVYEVNT